MQTQFGIKVYKQYFNFSASHFLIFKDGTREPLHGHNYRVEVRGDGHELDSDMVFDFLHLKPIVRALCQELDHKLILPQNNSFLSISIENNHLWAKCLLSDQMFCFPQGDVLLLPICNTSAERLAAYFASRICDEVLAKYQFRFSHLEVEVEETPGQSAVYRMHQ